MKLRAILLLLAATTLASAANHYTVAVLQTPPGESNAPMHGINSSGQVIGVWGNQIFIASTSDASVVPVSTVFGNVIAPGNINDLGQVALMVYGSAAAKPLIRSSNPTGFGLYIGTTSAITPVSVPGSAWAADNITLPGINNFGQLAATGYDFDAKVYQAFIGTPSSATPIPLPPGWSYAYAGAINDSGQVAGVGGPSGGLLQLFIGTPSGTAVIPLPPGSLGATVTAINSSGQVAGYAQIGSGQRAFIATASGIALLPSAGLSGWQTLSTQAINDAGVVVGTEDSVGWVWDRRNGTRRLSTLVPPGWTVFQGISINNQGVILATASYYGGPTVNVLLTPSGLEFVPLAPCRIMDTRNATGPFGGPFLSGGATRTVPVQSSSCSVPAAASAYSLSTTVVPRKPSLGYLTAWPAGQPQPNVSTLNSPDGSIVSNAAIVPAGANGDLNFFVTDDADLVLDINGYFTTPGTGAVPYFPLTSPCRVMDTRGPAGPLGGPFIAANTTRLVGMRISPCFPGGFPQAYALNITAVPHGPLGYLTVWPNSQPRPNVSTLNSPDGTVRAVAAIVPAGAIDQSVNVFATDDTDLVVDLVGYFTTGFNGLDYFPVTPCRVADTRGGLILAAGADRTFSVASTCGLPPDAGAYSLNMTVVPEGFLGYLTAWPTGNTQPPTSTLNDPKGIVLANAALLTAGLNGSIDVFATSATHLVIDTTGYFK